MWSNPFSSFGWPNEIPSVGLVIQKDLLCKKIFNILAHIIKKYPYRAVSKPQMHFINFL